MKLTTYLNFVLCVCVTVLVSCSSEEPNNDDIRNNAKKVSSTVIPHDFLLGNPYQIAISDSILFIADNHDGTSLALFDVKNNSFLGRRLKIGQGPNEVYIPLMLARTNDYDDLSVFQRSVGKHARYDLSDLVHSIISPRDTLTFKNTDRLAQTSDGYIAAGEYPEASIRLLDNRAKLLDEIDIYPAYISGLKSIASKYIFGQGQIAFNKKSNVFAFGASFTGELLFHQLHDGTFSELKRYDFSLSPSLKNRVNGNSSAARIEDNDIQYFADIFSSTDHFYFLYSGVPMKDRRSTPYSYIFKFSSKGEFVESFKTDIKILSMCVNQDDTKIYGIGLSKDFEYVLVEVNI